MVGAALALLLAFLGGAAMIRWGPRLGFVDVPDGFLKPHTVPAVPLGGVALIVAVHAGLAAEGMLDVGLLAASGLLLVLGLVDDRVGLAPWVRLAVQVASGVALAMLADLPALPGGWRSIAIAVLLVVVTVNAVNLFDGLDGLAGSVGLVTAGGIAVLAVSRGLGVGYGVILAAAVAGFLVWNWPPARLFLGDNGAYVLSIFLVHGFLDATGPSNETPGLVAFGLLGVFAVDLLVTLLRRRLAGRPLFEGDRSHVYDQLVDRGWSVPVTVAVFAVGQLVVAATVVIVDRTTPAWISLAVLAVVLVAVVLALVRAGFLRTDV